jgi:hypothetical protein
VAAPAGILMAKPSVQRNVQCYHCRHRFDVAAMAKSTVCPSCNKALLIEDVVVTTHKAVRKIQTCGKVIVQKKGHVIAQLVEAISGVEVIGTMEASVVTQGSVHLGKAARWKGNCRAVTLSAELGCVITSGYFEIHAGVAEPAAPKDDST